MIIPYDTSLSSSLSIFDLLALFKVVIPSETKVTEVLIHTSKEEIWEILRTNFPEYTKIYSNKLDERWNLILFNLLQKDSEIVFAPDISGLGFLGDLEHKIQFTFTDLIKGKVVDSIFTIHPKYIFEISFDSDSRKSDLSVYYKVFKFNEVYEECWKISSETEMYDRIAEVIEQGCLPVRNNRLVCDLEGDFYSISEFKNLFKTLEPEDDSKRFCTEICQEHIRYTTDLFYNQRRELFPTRGRRGIRSTLGSNTGIYRSALEKLKA